ncbi:MAG: ACT domain-containing protein [Bryobacterales bacterium]|nr:ACT domain-containing protein [Bryobacteraceae bacterium]MDW8130083.1 ACT domain-containing protein [Bryobacterales bacterium]
MAISVKRITLWRAEVANQPGVLAATLKPLAEARANLSVVMGYRYKTDPSKAAIELYPVTGKKATAAAQAAGLAPYEMPTLLVEGDDRPGLGHAIAEAIAGAGINLAFLVTQVIGRKYSAVMAFENEEDLKKAASLIKKVKAPRGK